MGDDFDPYHKWLGIPPEEQPPDHYRLLGLRVFENDAEVIENAAEARLLLLRTRQTGRHAQACQRLLNEIAIAQRCLLDPEARGAYDRQLLAAAREQTLEPPEGDETHIHHETAARRASRRQPDGGERHLPLDEPTREQGKGQASGQTPPRVPTHAQAEEPQAPAQPEPGDNGPSQPAEDENARNMNAAASPEPPLVTPQSALIVGGILWLLGALLGACLGSFAIGALVGLLLFVLVMASYPALQDDESELEQAAEDALDEETRERIERRRRRLERIRRLRNIGLQFARWFAAAALVNGRRYSRLLLRVAGGDRDRYLLLHVLTPIVLLGLLTAIIVAIAWLASL